MLDEGKDAFLSLKRLVYSASAHLDEAEKEFEEGLFAPFWDEVEDAANALAEYHQRVNTVSEYAHDYLRRASALSVPVPKFDIPARDFSDARPVAERLFRVVREAQ